MNYLRVTLRHNVQAIAYSAWRDAGAIVDFCYPFLGEIAFAWQHNGQHSLELVLYANQNRTAVMSERYSLNLKPGDYLLRDYSGRFFIKTYREFDDEWIRISDEEAP